VRALYGDASRAAVLAAAHPERARLILITTTDPFQARAIMDLARKANPSIETVVRTHSEEERAYLEANGVGMAVLGERELARTMALHALATCRSEPATPAESESVAAG
jgi:CPA2 family monovalent cation:H+ antiporter-2